MNTRVRKLSGIAVVVGILFFSALYIAAIGPYWKITPDSATYVSGAQSLASGHGYDELLFPPVTSLIFGICWLMAPGNYILLNAAVKLFVLAALALFYYLFKREIGGLKSACIIMFSLGSVYLFDLSTFLLSDIFYMFFSALTILMIGATEQKRISPIAQAIFAASLVLFTCMTRMVGISLALAILLYGLARLLRKRKASELPLIVAMVVVLVLCLLWEYRNLHRGLSYLKLFFQKVEYIDESGRASFIDLLQRFLVNLKECWVIGRVLTNGFAEGSRVVSRCLQPPFIIMFFVGWFLSMRRAITIMGIYVALYLLFIELHGTSDWGRYLIPILPFLLYYSLIGFESAAIKTRVFKKPLLSGFICVAIGLYAAIYFGSGILFMSRMIPEEHRSPFGEFPIKYDHNFDEQKLGMLLKGISKSTDRYVCMHPDVMNYIIGRKGYGFPFSNQQERILGFFNEEQIRFVLLDKTKSPVQDFLIPTIKAHADRFILIQDRAHASLYAVKE